MRELGSEFDSSLAIENGVEGQSFVNNSSSQSTASQQASSSAWLQRVFHGRLVSISTRANGIFPAVRSV